VRHGFQACSGRFAHGKQRPRPAGMREQTIWLAGKRHVLQQHSTMMKPAGAHTSPYLEFYREQRPLLPADLSNADREKAVSHRWKALSMAERAVYAQGLTRIHSSGTGRSFWRLRTPPVAPTIPTPPSAAVSATFLAVAGCTATVAAAASAPVRVHAVRVTPYRSRRTSPTQASALASAERTAKTAPPARARYNGRGELLAWPPASAPCLPPAPTTTAVTVHSEGELDRILQEQLARLRSSWSHESSWHCSR